MNSLNISSETGILESVLLHEPGPEVENMTPASAERALYSDILNQSVASREYSQFKDILKRVASVYELNDLLLQVLQNEEARNEIIQDLARFTHQPVLAPFLKELPVQELLRQLIEGVPFSQLSLTNFLNQEKYLLSPLHNAFYTRDVSFIIGDTAYISAMAKRIRVPETIMMNAVFKYSSFFSGRVISLCNNGPELKDFNTIEGGDVIVFSSSILIVGVGSRTTTQGIDWLINRLAESSDLNYVLVQELPDQPESFIHLDMVFTLLSHDECLLYEPIIMGQTRYHTVLITIRDKQVERIEYVENLITGLKKLGHDMKYLSCGGSEKRMQEREQWHSGANLFAIAPSKVIGYDRNIHTAEELSRQGYSVIKAAEIIQNGINLQDPGKVLITIEGSELSRGGGGTRCMTLPLRRRQ